MFKVTQALESRAGTLTSGCPASGKIGNVLPGSGFPGIFEGLTSKLAEGVWQEGQSTNPIGFSHQVALFPGGSGYPNLGSEQIAL